jgi:putative Ca2+/H+ antiporter (TMEM165/GDT1 family)
MFAIGAVVLLREGLSHHRESLAEGEAEFGADAKPATGFRAVLASFLVLFAAEWGDLSQLLTISLVARYEAPGSVFVGALGALLVVSGLAVIVGRTLLRFVALHVLHYVGAAVCLVLAVLTLVELVS